LGSCQDKSVDFTDILFWESEMRIGPYLLLEHYGLLGEVQAPCYEVRIERGRKIWRWEYRSRGKALAFLHRLAEGYEPPVGEPVEVRKPRKERGFAPPEKKWQSRLHPDE
jgi:hypothetical protein